MLLLLRPLSAPDTLSIVPPGIMAAPHGETERRDKIVDRYICGISGIRRRRGWQEDKFTTRCVGLDKTRWYRKAKGMSQCGFAKHIVTILLAGQHMFVRATGPDEFTVTGPVSRLREIYGSNGPGFVAQRGLHG
jgi:hypothetical protein